MERARLGTGEPIAAVAGTILLVSLFLPWYGWEILVADVRVSARLSAWEALTVVDVLVFLVALVAICVPAARAADSLPAELPAPFVLVCAGALGVLLIVFRIVDLPISAGETVAAADRIEVGRQIGAYIALVAAAGIVYGGWRANRET